MGLKRGFVTVVASVALFGGGLALAPTAAQATTATCNDSTVSITDKGIIQAGFYSGTMVPSSSQVTDAGLEAQCILIWRGYSLGAFDGVFGPKSQPALKLFQAEINREAGHQALAVDGSCGSQTWPYLRAYWWGPVGN
jgi:peptidoglycan hydrolase-like protein with peptidoglycan-binding domain